MTWTPENVERLKTLWAMGLSASIVAQRLFGTSAKRSAVIGKVHRLGLPGRDTKASISVKARQNRKAGRKRHEPHHRWQALDARARAALARSAIEHERVRAEPDLDIPAHELKPILVKDARGRLVANDDLDAASCRWAMTPAPPHAFCGKETVPGLSWCPFHAARAINPAALAQRLSKAETEAYRAKRKEAEKIAA